MCLYIYTIYIIYNMCVYIYNIYNTYICNITYIYVYIYIFFRAKSVAYGSPPPRRQIRDAAAGLHHSHSNTTSEQNLQLMPQLTASQILNPMREATDWTHIFMDTSQVLNLLSHNRNSLYTPVFNQLLFSELWWHLKVYWKVWGFFFFLLNALIVIKQH